jgi:trimeric autotransporter adhesin
MKRHYLLIVLFAFMQSNLFAQNVAINTTGAAPNTSAMLDVSSTTSGILIPRMTSTEKTSIVSPATGLLVYDTTTGTFWYFDGVIWVELGAGGGGGCSTLQQAYDCGGAGVGRSITANSGSVDISLTASSIDNNALSVSATNTSASTARAINVSQTGYGFGIYANSTQSRNSLIYANARSAGSTYAIAAVEAYNENYGSAVYGEIISTSSQYSAIQGVSNYNTTTAGTYPAGISGYFDGFGMGVGVWGEASGNGTSMGAGVYGKGLNNNFGVTAFSNTRPGLNAYTNSTSYQAAQIAAGGSNPLNPAMLVVGSVDFTCSNAAGSGSTYKLNSVSSNPSLSPDVDGWGFIGINTHAIWALYTYNIVNYTKYISI